MYWAPPPLLNYHLSLENLAAIQIQVKQPFCWPFFLIIRNFGIKMLGTDLVRSERTVSTDQLSSSQVPEGCRELLEDNATGTASTPKRVACFILSENKLFG